MFDDTPSRPCKSWCPIGGMAWSEDIVSLGVKAKGAGSNIYSSSVESSLLLFPPLDIIMLARHPADIISESESFSFFIDTPQHRREQDSAERTSINHYFDHTIVLSYFFVFTASISLSLWERMAGGCMGGCWRVAPPKKIWISYSETRYWNRFMVWISSIHLHGPAGRLCITWYVLKYDTIDRSTFYAMAMVRVYVVVMDRRQMPTYDTTYDTIANKKWK